MLQKEDEDVAEVFPERLEREFKRLNNIPFARLIRMTPEDEENHRIATMCWLCGEALERTKFETTALYKEISWCSNQHM